jgi:DNA primase
MLNLNESEEQFDLTKSSLIDLIDEKEIFNDYGVPYEDFEFKNPIRNENKSSCKFYYNGNNELYLVDFSGWFRGNVFDFVMFMEGKTFKETLLLIYERYVQKKSIPFSVYRSKQVEKSKTTFKSYSDTKIDVDFSDFNKSNSRFWTEQGITINTLNLFKVKLANRVDVNNKIVYVNSYSFKAYMYYFGKVENVHRVKIYFPGMDRKFITNSREIEGLKQLSYNKNELVITKSLKDVMLLYEFGIESIAPPSEGFLFSEEFIESLQKRYNKIYVLFDFDYAGVRGMQRLKKSHGIEPILLQERREYVKQAKDLTDHYKLFKSNYLESLKHKNLTIKQLVQEFRVLLNEKNNNTSIH